jgi:hypothetical protein
MSQYQEQVGMTTCAKLGFDLCNMWLKIDSNLFYFFDVILEMGCE